MPSWKGKDVIVVGLGKSGAAAVRFLSDEGARLTICDAKTEAQLAPALEGCRDAKFALELGPFSVARFAGVDAIVLSPGVPRTAPAVQAALSAGVLVTNELSLALERITAPVLAVTGSAGKTTTCSLAAAFLRNSGKRVYLGGNIGFPLLDLVRSGAVVDAVVAEMSSFQLETIEAFRPAVTLFTPIGDDHLDRYPSAEAYHEAKRRLLKFGGNETVCVVKQGNPVHERFAREAPGPVLWYGAEPLSGGRDGAWFEESSGRVLFRSRSDVVETRDRLVGMGNRENVASAACAALTMDADVAGLQRAVDGFGPLKHRMELVRERGGVRFFNDSKSTNVISALSALGTFRGREVVLIAGGRNKAIDFAPLRDEVARTCRSVVLVGEAKPALRGALEGAAPLFEASTFAEAVRLAAGAAKPGDSVVLSPACASHDLFRDYEDRGDTFRRLVESL